ncbi:MAG: hypothetical protein KBE68_02235, partial [Pseudoxanthomonas sp.]|nr:hypothetical protein [Pseudoxanthomonas sp.]
MESARCGKSFPAVISAGVRSISQPCRHSPVSPSPSAATAFELPPGTVALVGAGPGDPGLLTLHALRALEAAEVLLYDRLVGPEVLALAAPAALRVEVGKAAGQHSVAQEQIHAL